MPLPWREKNKTCNASIARKSANKGGRLIVSTSNLSAAAISIFLMIFYMNWNLWRVTLTQKDKLTRFNGENVGWIRPTNEGDKGSSSNINSTLGDLSHHLVAPAHLEDYQRTNNKAPIKFREGLDRKNRLRETKDYLKSLATDTSFNFTNTEIQSTMNEAYVYRPGPWDGAGIVIEEFKLVFFTQGKVACTVFKQLFRRMMHKKDWRADTADLTHNPRKNGLTYLYHYNFGDAFTILTHPAWTRAIFVRDPKERTLSAFLDKAARKNGKYVKRHCCNQGNSTCGEEANGSFLGFLRVIEGHCCCDPHWRPQSKRIDNFFMPFINFVGHFDRIQDDTKKLFERLRTNINMRARGDEVIDLWESFGASGWGRSGNESIFSLDTKAKHQTSAISKLRQYYNSSSEALVEKIFAEDYKDPILNFTRYLLSAEDR